MEWTECSDTMTECRDSVAQCSDTGETGHSPPDSMGDASFLASSLQQSKREGLGPAPFAHAIAAAPVPLRGFCDSGRRLHCAIDKRAVVFNSLYSTGSQGLCQLRRR
jgi:hypothetical protein